MAVSPSMSRIPVVFELRRPQPGGDSIEGRLTDQSPLVWISRARTQSAGAGKRGRPAEPGFAQSIKMRSPCPRWAEKQGWKKSVLPSSTIRFSNCRTASLRT